MSTHLRDTEFVDFAEGTLGAPRAAHLETCARCRAQAEEVAAMLHDVAAVEMPEPSPLFWDHFSARVREHVAHETPERAAWWSTAGVGALMPVLAALAILVAVFSAALLPRLVRDTPVSAALAPTHATPDATTAAADVDLPASLPPSIDDNNAGVWDVLTAAASDIGVDEAHAAGMGAHVGAVDHEVTHLSQAELTELGRLLQTQLKGAGH